MRKYIKYLCGLCLLGVLCGTTTSCEDMLSPDSERHSYTVAQDSLYSYWGIVKSLQNVAERYIVLGECRGELVDGTGYVSDSIKAILDFDMSKATDGSCRYLNIRDYYHIINSCNAYLAYCDRERTTGTLQPYMLKEAAQVEAIRAWTYLQMVQVYGTVPFFTEPLLTTDDIYAFTKQNKTVDIDQLVDELAPGLEEARKIEFQYGMPQYENYSNVCHSSKVMIPLNIILGDLYLAKGDKLSCEKAAGYYYDYLSNNQGLGNTIPGGGVPDSYAYGYKSDGMEQPLYLFTSASDVATAPWAQTNAVDAKYEAITAIPSSTNKLWGTVLRGVNELFGYSSEIQVRTSETSDTTSSTSASVILTAKYDVKQLSASAAYEELCDSQKYEVYIASDKSSALNAKPTVDPEIGDARQCWVRDVNQTYPNGLRSTEKFIKKINPQGSDLHPDFSTVGHMIYRKSMIWLRYAEALNRAGFPSYAFAILKNGLCNNDEWQPDYNAEVDSMAKSMTIPESTFNGYFDYAVKDTDWIFLDSTLTQRRPISKEYYDTKSELLDSLDAYITNGEMTTTDVNAGFIRAHVAEFENYPDSTCKAPLYYLNRHEMLKASRSRYLNFTYPSLDGNFTAGRYYYRKSLTENDITPAEQTVTGDDNVTYGIHSHGCGMLHYDEQYSVYNYVDMVSKKAKENYGVTLTKDDIYSGNYDDVVQKAVEDLIVDEEALELAFEGTRFFDLLRVAHRRNDPSYLANKLGQRDPALKSKLLNPKNWYFPLP